MCLLRKKTRQITIGNVKIGGSSPIVIQSMTNTNTKNIDATLKQIKALYAVGCQLVRVSIPDEESVECIKDIINESPIPIIGDIHIDYKLAIKSIKAGIHAVRINPGNMDIIGLKKVVELAGEKNISIRIGLNTGSMKIILPDRIDNMKKVKLISDALVDSAVHYCNKFSEYGYQNIKVSMKSTDVFTTIFAYRKFSDLIDYPLHIGITEAGGFQSSMVKSSIGIGSLLVDGIGDTMRVSMTGDPLEEVKISKLILESIGLLPGCPNIISCPTCSRNSIELIKLFDLINKSIDSMKEKGIKFREFTIAIMGCLINGINETKKSDIGIMGLNGKYIFLKQGIKIGSFKNMREVINVFNDSLKDFIISKIPNNLP